MAMTGNTYVDGRDIYAEYGVYITSGGWNSLVAMPPLKTPDSNDWQEEDGVEVDLSSPVLDTKEVTVSFACAPDASRIAGFLALLSDGAYHTFRCDWIGRTYRLRMVSQSKLSYNPALGTFSLKLADDFPLDGYEYAEPESAVPTHDDYLLDGSPLTDYGVRVLSGTLSNVLSMPAVKTALLRNVSVLAGAEYDGASVTFGSKDVKVQCLMRASTLEGLWRNWDALLYDLARPGERTLYCADAGRTFPCWYKSCSVSSFSPGGRPWLQFALTLTFTYDTHMDEVVFRIVPTPSDARVTVNGREVTFAQVSPGTEVEWTVEREGYVTASGTQTVTEDTTLPVDLERETYTVTFRVSPTDAIVTVNGTAYTPDSGGAVTVYAQWGDVLEWSVTRDGYGSRSGSLTVKGSSTVEVTLVDAGSIISGMTYDDIPAGGGTVLPVIAAVEGASLTYSGEGVDTSTGAVTADSLGTTVKARAGVTTVTVTAEYGGSSVSASCEVYQQENRVERTDTVSETFGAVSVSLSYGKDIPAGGGSVTPDLEYSQTVTGRYTDTYTSGATETRSGSFTVITGAGVTYSGATDSSTGAVSAGSLGTTVRERTLLATVAVTVTLNGETASASATVYQEENRVESTANEDTYSDITITGGFEYDDIGAGGGSVTPTAVTYSQTHTTGHSETYTSGEVKSDGTTETLISGASISYSGTGVNASTGAVTASSLGTTEKSRSSVTTATVEVEMNGKSASKDTVVYQAQNIIESESSGTTYSVPAVSLSYEVDGVEGEDIPAGGGTAKPVLSYSQTKTTGHSYTYSSGEVRTSDGETETITGGGTATYSGTGVASDGTVTASSLGTTVKDRTVVATATVTVTLNNKSGTADAVVYQEANKVEDESSEMTYDKPYILDLKWDDIDAGGGTVTPTFSVEQEATTWTHRTYTSGATEDVDFGNRGADTSGAALTFTASAGSAAIDGTTGAVTAGSLGTEERERTRLGTYTVTAECNGVSSAAYTGEVWQQENVVVSSTVKRVGEELEIRGFSYPDVPAEGGTVRPTVEFHYCYNEVRVLRYTSGETETDRAGGDVDFRVTESDGVETQYRYGSLISPTYLDGGAFTWDDAATSLERKLLATVTCEASYTSPETGEELTATATAEVWQEARETWLRVDPDSLTFDAGGGSAQVEVDSSTSDFEVEGTSADWIITRVTHVAGSQTGTVRVTAASNTATSSRSGSVTLANGDGCAAEIAVTQEGASSGGGGGTGDTRTLTLNITVFAFAGEGGGFGPQVKLTSDGATSSPIAVSTGTNSWTCSASFADGSEVSYEVSMDGYATVTGSVTMDEDRTVSVTLRASSGGGLLG